jgi:hypothetical protein
MTSLVAWWSELLTTKHEVPGSIPGSAIGEDPHSDYGLGRLKNLGLRPLLVLQAHTYHHSHHRGYVTTPYGRPKLRSQLHFATTRMGDHEVYMDMWWQWAKKKFCKNLRVP